MAWSQLYPLSVTVPITAGATTLGASPGGLFAGIAKYERVLLVASLAALSTVTLDAYIQGSPDDGTTWWDLCHFPQVAGAGTYSGAVVPTLGDGAFNAINAVAGTPLLAASKIVPLPWPNTLRLVCVSGAGSAGAGTKVNTVNVFVWRGQAT